MSNFSRAQIAEKLATRNDVAKSHAEKMVKDVFDVIAETLISGEAEKITIMGFGVFTIRHRDARVGRNPRTGAPLDIPASKALAFHGSKNLFKA